MSARALLERAFRLQSAGDAAGAEKLYAQALKSVRNNPALWFNHGLVLRELGRNVEALRNFEQVLALMLPGAQAQAAEVESERGAALMALNRFEVALAALLGKGLGVSQRHRAPSAFSGIFRLFRSGGNRALACDIARSVEGACP